MFEMVFTVILAIVLILFIVLGYGIPQQSNPADFVEARGFPVIFSLIALLLLAGIVFDNIKKKRQNDASNEKVSEMEPKNAYKILLVVAITILYILFVSKIGFVIFTLMAVYIFLNVLGSKKQLFNVIFSFVTVALLTLIFGRFFGISLPRGVGMLRELSFYLY